MVLNEQTIQALRERTIRKALIELPDRRIAHLRLTRKGMLVLTVLEPGTILASPVTAGGRVGDENDPPGT